ncbi:aldose epimerase family protein [Pseudooceanicola sp. C21-150M6]|uniref:aldose epimerase family protein n=1 Tax=Pseudooceanicola sp. C21-150M6 TaxID=3434355 RepID=UPI003D7F5D82
MSVAVFGTLPDGRDVDVVTLRDGGMEARILTFGATVQDLRVSGQQVCLGGDRLEDYLGSLRYAGAMVGRYANRIGGARFTLDGVTYHTDPNFRDRHTLHGGAESAGGQLWALGEVTDASVTLSLTMQDGHMGFPGVLTAEVTYRLDSGALVVEAEAVADRATPCCFAHHSYFVLDGSDDITGHRLKVAADRYLAVDADLIPEGPPAEVAGTAFDFRQMREIGTSGYDHNFCLSDAPAPLRPVAWLDSPASGLRLTVETTEPGLQVYDGAHLGGAAGYGGTTLHPKAGLAMEAQAWPDSPNRPDFPQAILRPGEVWRSETRYRFDPM